MILTRNPWELCERYLPWALKQLFYRRHRDIAPSCLLASTPSSYFVRWVRIAFVIVAPSRMKRASDKNLSDLLSGGYQSPKNSTESPTLPARSSIRFILLCLFSDVCRK